MTKSIIAKHKKRGRPATGKTPMIGVRASPALRRAIETWAKRQGARRVRSEAVRRLVELGLAGSTLTKQTSPKEAAKASDMAGRQIDKLANPAMPEEERRAR